MDPGKTVVSGVSVVAPDISSSHHMPITAPIVHIVHDQNTKRRGRPKKPIADDSSSMAVPSMLPSSSAPPATGKSYVEQKKPVLARPINSEKKQRNKVGAEKLDLRSCSASQRLQTSTWKLERHPSDDWLGCSTGSSFTPHLITVNTGEDISMKLMEFSLQGPRTVCVISGNGTISSVTLRYPTCGGTLTHEGLFEIMCFSGSFSPVGVSDIFSRSGVMSISLSAADGRVLGGPIGGPTIAASPVEVFVVSFLMGSLEVPRPKKPKTGPKVRAGVEGSVGPATGVERSGSSSMRGGSTHGNPNNWGPPKNGEKANAEININLQR